VCIVIVFFICNCSGLNKKYKPKSPRVNICWLLFKFFDRLLALIHAYTKFYFVFTLQTKNQLYALHMLCVLCWLILMFVFTVAILLTRILEIDWLQHLLTKIFETGDQLHNDES
jgi:hypothetical protein